MVAKIPHSCRNLVLDAIHMLSEGVDAAKTENSKEPHHPSRNQIGVLTDALSQEELESLLFGNKNQQMKFHNVKSTISERAQGVRQALTELDDTLGKFLARKNQSKPVIVDGVVKESGMKKEFLNSQEVEALLKGVTGETDEAVNAKSENPRKHSEDDWAAAIAEQTAINTNPYSISEDDWAAAMAEQMSEDEISRLDFSQEPKASVANVKVIFTREEYEKLMQLLSTQLIRDFGGIFNKLSAAG